MEKVNQSNDNIKKKKLITINALTIPIIALLVALHIVVVALIININRNSVSMTETAESTKESIADATALLAGVSQLSESCISFVVKPRLDNNNTNIGPLNAFAAELSQDHRGADIIKKLSENGADNEAINYIRDAGVNAGDLLNTQLYALALVNSIYPFPPQPNLDVIRENLPELEQVDTELTNEEKINKAQSLVLSERYGSMKYNVNQNVTKYTTHLQDLSDNKIKDISKQISTMQTTLLIHTALVIITFTALFIGLYKNLIYPLAVFTKSIESDKEFDTKNGYKETKLLAYAYNNLLKRRDELDSKLRSMAEKDFLTGLNNRYKYEQCLESIVGQNDNKSFAYILFDVNYLKLTNDTIGHEEGDNLLTIASKCIGECFGQGSDENCFRVGGDEFVSIMTDITLDELEERAEKFKSLQKANKASVSYGYAYSDTVNTSTIRKIMKDAEIHMYSNKENMHKQYLNNIA